MIARKRNGWRITALGWSTSLLSGQPEQAAGAGHRVALFIKRATIVLVIGAMVAAGGYFGWQKYQRWRAAKAEAAKPWGNATVLLDGLRERAMVESLSMWSPCFAGGGSKQIFYCGRLEHPEKGVDLTC
jgi:hypothetical protein